MYSDVSAVDSHTTNNYYDIYCECWHTVSNSNTNDDLQTGDYQPTELRGYERQKKGWEPLLQSIKDSEMCAQRD